jgi:hypothetical protein
MQSRRLILAAATLIAASLPAQAFALCSVCTAVVRLDAGLAECFAHRAADEIKKLQAGAAFVVVDLGDCPNRGGLPTGDANGPAPALDSRFIADAAAIECLNDQIAQMDDSSLTPSHVFELNKDCPAQ